MDLSEALKQPEGKTLEFKRDLSSPEKVLRTIVAFANTAGGRVVLGVDDRSRSVPGIAEPLKCEERLASLISDSIEPRLVPDLAILPWRQAYLVAVEVDPGANRPYHLAREGSARGTYVRVGSTNRRADHALTEEIRRQAQGESFDEQPTTDTVAAVDVAYAKRLFQPVRPLTDTDLDALRITTAAGRKRVVTNGGILVFGTHRLQRFPDAWIQVGRFGGIDRSVIRDHAEYRDFLVDATEAAIAFVGRYAERRITFGPARHREESAVPMIAVREAVINAVAHADYSQRGAPIRIAMYDDRIEVENPGLLPWGLLIEDLPRGVSRLRNRVIGRVFKELNLIEQWGSGVQRMIGACREAGLDAPSFEEVGARFRVTIPLTVTHAPSLDATDARIVVMLADGDGLTTSQVAQRIARTPRTARTRLSRLESAGLVRGIGSSPRDPQRRYVAIRPASEVK